jgi:hypothetical protein
MVPFLSIHIIFIPIIFFIATYFFTHVFNKFLEKTKNSKKIMKTLKKYIFDIFTLFLAFLTSSQKNLNF